MADYSPYELYVKYVCESEDLSNFKTHPNYTYMLEHVSPMQGNLYLIQILNNTTITTNQILEYCIMNDSIGNPNKYNYDIVNCSPTSLRYIWFSHKIFSHLKSLNKTSYDIVEIGGGYGGLSLALNFFSSHYSIKISNYSIIDLTWPSKLQSIYLSNFSLSFPVSFHNAVNYGEDIHVKDAVLISTYSFSEIDDVHQKQYISKLFPKISHGFFAWNYIPTYNFGFTFTEEEEIPMTGSKYNKFVLF